MAKNYYRILGVLPSATMGEIRSAYRSRAKQYHPDHFGQDTAPFMDVQEAYDILGDPTHRDSYDRRRRQTGEGRIVRTREGPEVIGPRRSRAEPLRASRKGADLGTISALSSFRTFDPSIDEIFDSLGSAFGSLSQTKSERFRTLTMEVVLTPDQAARGGIARIILPVAGVCPTCDGTGDTTYRQCVRCGGTGIHRMELPLEVQYPPGIRDLYRVAIPLDSLGIHEICAVLLFRINPIGDFEGL